MKFYSVLFSLSLWTITLLGSMEQETQSGVPTLMELARKTLLNSTNIETFVSQLRDPKFLASINDDLRRYLAPALLQKSPQIKQVFFALTDCLGSKIYSLKNAEAEIPAPIDDRLLGGYTASCSQGEHTLLGTHDGVVYDLNPACTGTRLKAHEGKILGIAHNGKKLISSSQDHTIAIWDGATHKELLRIQCEELGNIVYLHIINDHLVSVSEHGELSIRDLETGTILYRCQARPDDSSYEGINTRVVAAAGNIISIGFDTGAISIINLETIVATINALNLLELNQFGFLRILCAQLATGNQLNLADNPYETALFYSLPENIQTMLAKTKAVINIPPAAEKEQSSFALHLAAKAGNLKDVIKLMRKRCSCTVKDYRGNTPLHVAAMFGYSDIAKWLCLNGADITSYNNEGKTPIFLAYQYGHDQLALMLAELKKRPRRTKSAFLPNSRADSESDEGSPSPKKRKSLPEPKN